jgi:transcriptional regulator with XRE-family HTH domain
MESIHIGSLIRQKVDERGMTVSEFARRINCSRSNVYSIFNRSTLSLQLLQIISEVLNYNFFLDIYEAKESDIS